MDMIGKYQSNMDLVKQEFNLHELTSAYEVFNKLTEEYYNLKNQTKKEPEDGTGNQIKRGRPKKTDI